MAQSPYLDQLPLADLDHSTFNLPSRELLADTRFLDYVKICIPLYKSSAKGEFAVVRRILQDNNQQLIRLNITPNRDTVLHVAVTSGNFRLVEYLVGKMSDDDLSLQNAHGYTAFSLAASHGDAKMARHLVGRAPLLRTIRGKANMMPLHLAAAYGRREMTNDLYNLDGWTNGGKRLLFLKCVHSDLLDIARRMLTESHGSFLELSEKKMYIHGVLSTLALKPYAFEDVRPNIIWRVIMSHSLCIIGIFSVEERPPMEKSETTLLFRAIWRKILLQVSKEDILIFVRGPKFKKETGSIYSYRLAFVALEKDNTRFLVELLDAFPDIMWMINDENLSIFHVAALHRDESIYHIIHETGPMLEVLHSIKDGNGNNMLHLIGTNPRGNLLEAMPGAAFQMQRELLWFKEVEAMVPSEFVLEKNNDGLTPDKVFENHHKQLLFEGGQWLKTAIAQCIVVVALIATVGFTTNFTFPRGYDNDGLPIFLRSNSFLTFVVLNDISFVLSVASAIIFLSILWTCYHQDDFFLTLPKRLMVAVTSFFISIISLIVAFTINFFVLHHKKTIITHYRRFCDFCCCTGSLILQNEVCSFVSGGLLHILIWVSR